MCRRWCACVGTSQRRRKWSTEARLRILSEALEPGATVAAVADRNGVCRSQLYTWLRLVREDKMPGLSLARQPAASFMSVRIEPPACAPAPSPMSPPPAGPYACAPTSPHPPSRSRRPAVVEVTLTNGRVIKVDEGIDPAALAHIVTALDGAG